MTKDQLEAITLQECKKLREKTYDDTLTEIDKYKKLS